MQAFNYPTLVRQRIQWWTSAFHSLVFVRIKSETPCTSFFRFSRLYVIFWPVSLAQLSLTFFFSGKKGKVLMVFMKIPLFSWYPRPQREIDNSQFGWKLYAKSTLHDFKKHRFMETSINVVCEYPRTQGSYSAG